jgi:uncharacterized protein DUF6627
MGTEVLRRRLIAVLLVTLSLPAFHMGALPAHAMLIPNDPHVAQGHSALQRQEDLQKIQGVLEAKVIRQRLADLGFSPNEITMKLNGLSDEQLHFVATRVDSLIVGGFHGVDDVLHLAISILVIVLIVVLILVLI